MMARNAHRVLFLALLLKGIAAAAATPSQLNLHTGWNLQSSCKVAEKGAVLSTTAFKPSGWYTTTVPSTVLAAQVATGDFPDPFFGMNLRRIPGTTYPIAANFANLPMSKDSPYACSWWYRTEFRLSPDYKNRNLWLYFGGINYRANIWVNGQKLADSKQVAGAYRIYEFDATSLLKPGQANVLAVETFAPTETDLGINWVDWNPTPPDKSMGLWGDVYVSTSGPISLRYPQVVTHFPDDGLKQADLTVSTVLHNASTRAIKGTLEGTLENIRFTQPIELQAGETRSVHFTTQDFPQLRIKEPKLWWPVLMGKQDLHTVSLRVLAGGAVSDEQQKRFGIREITSELVDVPNHPGEFFQAAMGKIIPIDKKVLQFKVNGRRILIRGGGWASDMLLRRNRKRLEAEFEYVRDMHLNTIRLEGKLESDDFYDIADEKGILVMAGWCCCDHWEHWNKWEPDDLEIASESLRGQILRLRSHPSLLVWLNGSDYPPPGNVEGAYVNVLKQSEWPNPYISSASGIPTSLTGTSGVKMTGPYDYIPPDYWYVEPRLYGGPIGFNTETGPGPAIPLKSCLKKILPVDHLWPPDDFWKFHAGSQEFAELKNFNIAMDATYGAPSGLDDYVLKSQVMAYDGERAMFEAYGGNKYASTGVIQWMLNNSWPSLIWHLYDYYLQPAGGYFGTKKANEPVHVQYSRNDRSIVVVNNLYQRFPGLTVTAALYDFSLKEIFSKQVKVDVAEDSSQRVLNIPELPSSQSPEVFFVRLTLQNRDGEILSSNFYWLSNKPPAFEWAKTTFQMTPSSSYPDMTMLNRLPQTRIDATANVEHNQLGDQVRVRLHNPNKQLAFQIRLGVSKANQEDEVVPVLWDDNYLVLMPGETRTVTANYSANLLGSRPELQVTGWNIKPMRLALESKKSDVRREQKSGD